MSPFFPQNAQICAEIISNILTTLSRSDKIFIKNLLPNKMSCRDITTYNAKFSIRNKKTRITKRSDIMDKHYLAACMKWVEIQQGFNDGWTLIDDQCLHLSPVICHPSENSLCKQFVWICAISGNNVSFQIVLIYSVCVFNHLLQSSLSLIHLHHIL